MHWCFLSGNIIPPASIQIAVRVDHVKEMVPVEVFVGTVILIDPLPIVIKEMNWICSLHSCAQVEALIRLMLEVIECYNLTHDMGNVTGL